MNKRVISLAACLAVALIGLIVLQRGDTDQGSKMALIAAAPSSLQNWPPVVGKQFPSIPLIDHQGASTSLDKIRGKPTLIEFAAMSCKGCQGFSGGNERGGFRGWPVQPYLPSLEKILRQYGRTDLFSSELNFLQIIVYNLELDPPRKEDLAAWREHFGFHLHPNTHVWGGTRNLANGITFRMIPGFMLLDRDHRVCFDATGHFPKHDLYRVLAPAVRGVVRSGTCSTSR